MILRWTIWGVVLLVHAFGFCQIQNGGFEISDPNRATEWFTPPKCWDFENYAGLHSEFTPSPEEGQNNDPNNPLVTWSILNPFEGNKFLLLSTGDVRGPGSYTTIDQSAAEQTLHAASGDILIGAYFFGSCDYTPYSDFASIILKPADPNDRLRPITLVEIGVDDVGDYNATDGWQTFQHTFEVSQTGEYILRCKVNDKTDARYKSYLAVDGLRVCSAIPAYGDVNMDCGVDLQDFSIFANAWLTHDPNDPALSDPNTFDPNDYVFDGWNSQCDMEKNHAIDPNDLILMSTHWLDKF